MDLAIKSGCSKLRPTRPFSGSRSLFNSAVSPSSAVNSSLKIVSVDVPMKHNPDKKNVSIDSKSRGIFGVEFLQLVVKRYLK